MRTRSGGQTLNSSLSQKSTQCANPVKHIFCRKSTLLSRRIKHIEKNARNERVGCDRHCPSLQHTEDFLSKHPFLWCFQLTKDACRVLAFQLSPEVAGSGWQCQLLGGMLGQKSLGTERGCPHAGAPVRSYQVVNMGAQAPWVQETISTSKFYLELYEGVEFYSFPTVWNSTAVLLKAITSQLCLRLVPSCQHAYLGQLLILWSSIQVLISGPLNRQTN